MHAADGEVVAGAGALELFLDVSELWVGVAEQQGAEKGVVQCPVGRESRSEEPAGVGADPVDGREPVGAQDLDVVGVGDLERGEDALVSVVRRPV